QRRGGVQAVSDFTARIKPLTVAALVVTVGLLFAFQARTLMERPLDIALIAIPLLLQTALIFSIAFLWARAWRVPLAVAAPAALIATSNFFELAVAVAISLFGLHSGAALATVVGVLVEVPAMLALVALVNRSREWYQRGATRVA
ncbi:MAG: arsenic resistance protein, partial [Immundisolibacter sp.]|uniref:arsenic resistance protein n=1 Tax=Immundisolibacter sp. TaxID=1934948 RepID=UPI003EE10FC2